MKELLGRIVLCTLILNLSIRAETGSEKSCKDDSGDFRELTEIKNPFIKRVIRAGTSLTLPELIQSNGFPVETHTVTSYDGYITTLFRIPHGRFQNSDHSSPKKVVYLQHGFLVDSSSWCLNSVDKALAYRMADLGNVDLWMGNTRGTKSSLGHVNLHHKNYRYWNFTFHEVGVFDVPRIIDYILDVTGEADMYYTAHSMGCASLAVTLSTFPEYNLKIRTFIALGPAIFVGNSKTPLQGFIPSALDHAQDLHDLLLTPIGSPILLPYMSIIGDFCAPRVIFHKICYALVESFFGYDTKETNYDMSREIASHAFSSSSTKTLFHLFQLTLRGEFNHYDYRDRNYQVYGQRYPPQYDLSKVTIPTVLFCGEHDNLVPCVDVDRLAENLPNVKEHKHITWPKFNHIDFLYAKDINPLLNDRIIEIIENDIFYNK